jgi:hypothetical protein
MSAYVPRLSGEEWQRWANKLLTRHYGPTEYQVVPDNDRGDAGLEGFTVTSGHCYQAFGCEEPISTPARYAKQRDKMTEDIRKFVSNRTLLVRIFGNIKIKRWVLFVPYADSKEIIAHASKKTDEIIAAKLTYVGDEFRVMVLQEEDFASERDDLMSIPSSRTLMFQVEKSSEEAIAEWEVTNDRLAKILFDKIRLLPTLTGDGMQQKFHATVLRWYIEGQSILEALRQYPETYQRVVQTKAHRENYLVMTAASGRSPQEILQLSLQQLYDDLKAEVKELHSFSAEALAHEGVADWLLRCPLDFPKATNGNGTNNL